jgi:hypothetical protein
MHVIAIAWYVRVRRRPLIRAMLTGFKPVRTAPAASIGQPRWALAALNVLAVCAALACVVIAAPEADVALF